MLPFKKGAFHTAIHFQKTIVPVVVSTYYPEYSHNERFDIKEIRVRGMSCSFRALPNTPNSPATPVLPATDCKGRTQSDVDEILLSVRSQMLSALKDMGT